MRKFVLGTLAALTLATSASAIDLYSNNGSFTDPVGITNPGGGFGGGDLTALQTALGLNVFGFGAQATVLNSMAEDFTVPTGETWTIDEVVLYSYQTGATTTSITSVDIGLVSGSLNGAFPPPFTNVAVTPAFAGVPAGLYKATDTAPLGNTRRLQVFSVKIAPAYVANAGMHSVAWQMNGTLASGPWAPPIVVSGQINKPGSNGLQSIGAAAYAPVVDTGACACPQDFPFVLKGTKTGGGCTWDLNGDGKVCQEDLGILLAGWQNPYTQSDLGALLAQYNGGCGAPCSP